MAWHGEHRAFVVEEYIRNGGSAITTQRAFRIRFKLGRHDPVPDRKTIQVWLSNFRAAGSALKRKSSGRPLTATTPDNVARVSASIQQSPRRSAHAAALELSDRSVRRILHTHIHMHPYKMMITQELSARDFETRRAVCEDILQNIPVGAVLISSDEAHFHLSGTVNKQNFRYWATENPQEIHQRPLHSPYVTVWCAVAEFGVLGPYFFEENGQKVTVTADRYCHMIETFLRPNLNQFTRNHEEGHLKGQVYTHRPTSLEALKEAITQEVAAITPQMTRQAMESFRERLRKFVNNRGQYLTDIMFKTKLNQFWSSVRCVWRVLEAIVKSALVDIMHVSSAKVARVGCQSVECRM
ncbi:hypothetical protein QTP88_004793 [Uroleucon formosanum]